MDEKTNDSFTSMAEEKGWACQKAVGPEDYDEHWDWKITKGTSSFLVDVKSLKRVNSKDKIVSDQLLLVELQAVKNYKTNSRIGWLYGKADYICFEINEGFIFVPRNKLKEYVEKQIDISTVAEVSNQRKIAHKIYTRYGRNDRFVYFYKTEILPLAAAIWRKDV